MTISFAALAADGPLKGYIVNEDGAKCTYVQTLDPQSRHFTDKLTARTQTIVFDDPNCMKDSDLDLGVNEMQIGNVVSGWYGQSDARFGTEKGELRNRALFQTRGQCLQSATYPELAVMIEFERENDAIVRVHHALAVQGCVS